MKKIIFLILLFLTTGVMIALPVANAEILIGETRTINPGNYSDFRFRLIESSHIEVDIHSGGTVDCFLMNAENFAKYLQDEEFDYYRDISAFDVKTKRYTWEAPETNTYYVVVDYTDTSSVSPIDVRVHVEEFPILPPTLTPTPVNSTPPPPIPPNNPEDNKDGKKVQLAAVVASIVIIAVIIGGAIFYKKKREEEEEKDENKQGKSGPPPLSGGNKSK